MWSDFSTGFICGLTGGMVFGLIIAIVLCMSMLSTVSSMCTRLLRQQVSQPVQAREPRDPPTSFYFTSGGPNEQTGKRLVQQWREHHVSMPDRPTEPNSAIRPHPYPGSRNGSTPHI